MNWPEILVILGFLNLWWTLYGFPTLLSDFRWYRKLRGGRWARVTGLLWGKRWVRLPQQCVDRHEEQWRKRYCSECQYRRVEFREAPYGQRCWHSSQLVVVQEENYLGGPVLSSFVSCETRNRFMDCRDFEAPTPPDKGFPG